ncbi:MAG: hypothetical protein ACJA08_000200 [Cyclobacteriaceae bacterium]|jgi:hypothetical protein
MRGMEVVNAVNVDFDNLEDGRKYLQSKREIFILEMIKSLY